uniref:Mitochondrial-processing peptidase subunit alpha n=1 Tax=Lygus hesperus TaxID=30085 RepID=A0A0A9XTL2_LYGHE
MDSVVETLLQQLTRMVDISQVDVDNSKQQLRSTILMNLESHLNRAEDMARHVSIYKSYNPAQVLEKVDAVTVDDVRRVAQQLLQSPPSIACYGNVLQVPKLSTIASKLQ